MERRVQRQLKQETKQFEGRALFDLTLTEGYPVLLRILERRVEGLMSLALTPADCEWDTIKKEGYLYAVRELKGLIAEVNKYVSDWKSSQDITKGLDKHP